MVSALKVKDEFKFVSPPAVHATAGGKMTALPDGSFILAWVENATDGDAAGVFAQRLNASGEPIGDVFQVNTTTDHNQSDPYVLILANGNFVITWTGKSPTDVGFDIYGQMYSTDGDRIGSEFTINAWTHGYQVWQSMASLADGGFVVVWTSEVHIVNEDDTPPVDVYAQRFNAEGVAVGAEFRVNTRYGGDQYANDVVGLADGGFVVLWDSRNTSGGEGRDVVSQRYDANGAKVGGEVIINASNLAGDQAGGQVEKLAGGGYVVSWVGDRIYAQLYDAAWTPTGSAFAVNSQPTWIGGGGAVAGLSDGGFVFAWTTVDTPGGSPGIVYQYYDAQGHALGPETRVTTDVRYYDFGAGATALPNGGFMISWTRLYETGVMTKAYVPAADLTGAQVLYGTVAGDVLDGGTGGDSMYGGDGDDTYHVDDQADVVSEKAGEGIDTVLAYFSTRLSGFSQVENLTLGGTAALNGTGDGGNNVITGNSAANQLDGGQGADTLVGGLGNDTYLVDDAGDRIVETATGGTDAVLSSVSFSLAGVHADNLRLVGGAVSATGNNGNNILRGNDADNWLDGGIGTDVMEGGFGNDTYVVDHVRDLVREYRAGDGIDTVRASVSWTLGTYIENLVLTGGSAIDGTGNGLNNRLTGNAGNNVLAGGLGDDTYYIQNAGDSVIEAAGEGQDLLYSSVSYDLRGRHIETVILTGSDDLSLAGNSLGNALTGNDGANVLTGLAGRDLIDGGSGDDRLVGGTGNDTLTGGLGADVFAFQTGCNIDTITDFYGGDGDRIALEGVASYTVSQNGHDVLVSFSGGVVRVQDAVVADVSGYIVT